MMKTMIERERENGRERKTERGPKGKETCVHAYERDSERKCVRV
jgi:hypothetical protein